MRMWWSIDLVVVGSVGIVVCICGCVGMGVIGEECFCGRYLC